ncbi:MAG: hypothetical protein VB862_09385 [Pirellulaceae bacterium]
MPRKSASSDSPSIVQKMPLSVYTMMLVIAFMCITVACVLLWQELKKWGPGPDWWNATVSITAPADSPDSFQLARQAAEIEPFKLS